MSRGPGRWQRALISAVERSGHFTPILVAEVGLEEIGGPMSPSEYSALNRAARRLNGTALHLTQLDDYAYGGRRALRLGAWACPKCSDAATGEHIPLQPCSYCRKPTDGRSYQGKPDCGDHRLAPVSVDTHYPIEHSAGATLWQPIEPVLQITGAGVVLRAGSSS